MPKVKESRKPTAHRSMSGKKADHMLEEKTEEMVFNLIEYHLSEEDRDTARKWLETLIIINRAVRELGLIQPDDFK